MQRGGFMWEITNQPPQCPIVPAVEQRLKGAQLQRADGIILGSVDVDEFDVTLC
jgi:hypothetical protein